MYLPHESSSSAMATRLPVDSKEVAEEKDLGSVVLVLLDSSVGADHDFGGLVVVFDISHGVGGRQRAKLVRHNGGKLANQTSSWGR